MCALVRYASTLVCNLAVLVEQQGLLVILWEQKTSLTSGTSSTSSTSNTSSTSLTSNTSATSYLVAQNVN